MTGRLVAARARAVDRALVRLHDAMRQMRGEGASLRTIAKEAGMSHEKVREIVKEDSQ